MNHNATAGATIPAEKVPHEKTYTSPTYRTRNVSRRGAVLMTRTDRIALVVAIVSAVALIAVAVATDTPIFNECNVNTAC